MASATAVRISSELRQSCRSVITRAHTSRLAQVLAVDRLPRMPADLACPVSPCFLTACSPRLLRPTRAARRPVSRGGGPQAHDRCRRGAELCASSGQEANVGGQEACRPVLPPPQEATKADFSALLQPTTFAEALALRVEQRAERGEMRAERAEERAERGEVRADSGLTASMTINLVGACGVAVAFAALVSK